MGLAEAWSASLDPGPSPEAWSVDVSLTDGDEASATVYYNVRTRFEVTRSTTAVRRYGEFRTLRRALGAQARARAAFPGRTLPTSRLAPPALEKRRRGLATWLAETVGSRERLDDGRARALRQFLGVDEGWAGAAGADAASTAVRTPEAGRKRLSDAENDSDPPVPRRLALDAVEDGDDEEDDDDDDDDGRARAPTLTAAALADAEDERTREATAEIARFGEDGGRFPSR